jgi:hypothetical protein
VQRSCSPAIGLFIALLVMARPATAQQTSPAAVPSASDDVARWPYVLPFLAEEAVKRGYELPLPRGLSALFYCVERDISISDLRIGVDGAPLRSVSDFANLGSRSHVSVALARLDAWLLTRGTVTIPTLGPRPGSRTFDLSGKTELNGFLGGAGVTLAAGYKNFFLLGDINYSQTDIGFDDRFKALIGSVRTGWNGKVLDTPVRLWAGAMYWGTESTAKATVNVPNIGRVSFEADQGPTHPVNLWLAPRSRCSGAGMRSSSTVSTRQTFKPLPAG